MQDVQHCFEISSHTMCRLYNTAGISSAAATATATAALPAAVTSRRRLCGAGCVDQLIVWRRIQFEVYRKQHFFPTLRLAPPGVQDARPSLAPCNHNFVQDVHHCFEISSHTMCRLCNTAGMSSAAATATAALPAAVRSRRRLCGAGCVD